MDNVADGWTLPSESVLDSTRLQSRNRSREIEADGEVHIRHAGDIRRLPHRQELEFWPPSARRDGHHPTRRRKTSSVSSVHRA